MNYSQGEWKIIGSFITAPIDEHEIEICRLTQYRDDSENRANALLISAAPDYHELACLYLDAEISMFEYVSRLSEIREEAEGGVE